MTRIRISSPYINPNKTLEKYGNYVTVDNTGGGDYEDFQSALDAIIDADEDNKYIVAGYGRGVYSGQIILDKPFIKLAFMNPIVIESDQSPVLKISNNYELHENLYIRSINTTLNTDTVLLETLCSPGFYNSVFYGKNGAFSLRINEAVVELNDVKCNSNYNSIKIENSGVLVFKEGEINSGTSYKDIIQEVLSTVKLGQVQYNNNNNKLTLDGTLELLSKAFNIEFDNSNVSLKNDPENVQDAIEALFKNSIKSKQVNNSISPYYIDTKDKLLYIDSGSGAITLYMPEVSRVEFQEFDIYVSNYVNNITVLTQGGDYFYKSFSSSNQAILKNQNSILKLKALKDHVFEISSSVEVNFS